ncbi:YchJ family protein [Corynebacterium gerontici]|uniref:YchJ-like middle NTF2-like domain-containing protein n=1 Tax=Corynebacterium gerontici TaxID=2079234 RepID=A0A3G6J018_9CORY|nr:YchJ family metal-binding protein [Corynebacterium gerontici]AZA11375.1 hypothetical protein CGERO_05335 [Corynebacterium gerontici]
MGTPCPCGTGISYETCCGKFHRGEADAATAEQLMRSRFSAFAVGDAQYLLRTWDPSTAPTKLAFDPGVQYRSLQVLGTKRGGPFDQFGEVEFLATLLFDGHVSQQRERSFFKRVDRKWVYSTGIVD